MTFCYTARSTNGLSSINDLDKDPTGVKNLGVSSNRTYQIQLALIQPLLECTIFTEENNRRDFIGTNFILLCMHQSMECAVTLTVVIICLYSPRLEYVLRLNNNKVSQQQVNTRQCILYRRYQQKKKYNYTYAALKRKLRGSSS